MDHLYLFPNGSKLDDEIVAALEFGVRLQASRGSMSLGESKGGLPPDSVVDTEENILKDSQRLIEKYHDAKPGAMTQIVLAPCSPFSVTSDLMKQSAKMAREYGVHLHTHLAETEDEISFAVRCLVIARWDTCRKWTGSAVTSGSRTRFGLMTRKSRSLPNMTVAWRIAPPRTCGSPPALRRSSNIVRPVSTLAWAWTVIPGCPPRPEMVIDGIMKLQDKIARSQHPLVGRESVT